MRIRRSGLVFFLVIALFQLTHLRAQAGDPNGWHEGDGSYLSFWQDFFVEDGGVLTAIGVSEEDYDNFGHFVHVTTTLHGGGGNRVVTASATAKFFACAEASFAFQLGSDEGTYYNDVQYRRCAIQLDMPIFGQQLFSVHLRPSLRSGSQCRQI